MDALFAFSLACTLIALCLMIIPAFRDSGKLLLMCGAQLYMNFFMNFVLRSSVILPRGSFIEATNSTLSADLMGFPAGFALTAIQQLVAFVCFLAMVVVGHYTCWTYTPKNISTNKEMAVVCLSGAMFAIQIALNNLSLAYTGLAVQCILRAGMPLSNYFVQQVFACFGLYPWRSLSIMEWACMLMCVTCGTVFTIAEVAGVESPSQGTELIVGCLICILGMIGGSVHASLMGSLGNMKFNVFDTVAYMSVPAWVSLAPIIFFAHKPLPGEWAKVFPGNSASDWDVVASLWTFHKTTMGWIILSGVFAMGYNLVHTQIIHSLSPTAAAVLGNFNRVILVFITLLFPSQGSSTMPGMPYSAWMWGSAILNAVACSLYSYLEIQAKEASNKAAAAQIKIQPMDDTAGLPGKDPLMQKAVVDDECSTAELEYETSSEDTGALEACWHPAAR